MQNKYAFLGGTCNGSQWRDALEPLLKCQYFNPVVDDWNEEAFQAELKAKNECTHRVYVITPKMTGVYSIAEVVQDSNNSDVNTVFCVLNEDEGETFDAHQVKSLNKVGEMVAENGATVCGSLSEVADFLNS